MRCAARRRAPHANIHDCNRIPAASIYWNTRSGRQRSSLSLRQFEWQTIVATCKQREEVVAKAMEHWPFEPSKRGLGKTPRDAVGGGVKQRW